MIAWDPSDPHVAVGVPTYNNEDTIETTLEMLCSQTRPPDRIVVCDNSTDRTPDIVREVAETVEIPVTVLEQTGDGVAAAYNQLWEHVREEYDLFLTIQTNLTVGKDWIETHLHLHREHPDIGIVSCNQEGIDREVLPDERYYYTGRNVSFKRGVLETIDGWDENFLRGEDWDMQIRLAGAGVRSYRASSCAHGWISEKAGIDPYMTLSKARRRPTSVSFLAKFGTWYVWYHPSHVLHDLLSAGAVASGLLTVIALFVSPWFAGLSAGGTAVIVLAYIVGHIGLRGPVDGSYVYNPIKKQFLNGIGVFFALYRVMNIDHWKMTGFDPSSVPSYELNSDDGRS